MFKQSWKVNIIIHHIFKENFISKVLLLISLLVLKDKVLFIERLLPYILGPFMRCQIFDFKCCK